MRKVYKNNIKEALRWLTDYEFQKSSWIANNQNFIASYNEQISWVFEDTGLDEALKAGEVVFDIPADKALRDLRTMANKINSRDFTEEALLESPHMQAIREKAAHALLMIQVSVGHGSTVEMVE